MEIKRATSYPLTQKQHTEINTFSLPVKQINRKYVAN